jgi:MarR family transcriptional regulator, 2-MHQ and catechol-resistance regulon repressor
MEYSMEIPAQNAPERTDDEALALRMWVVLTRAQAALQRVTEADIARHDLSPGEFAILDVLYHKGPLLLGEVQKKVLVSSGGITYLVDRLAQRKLVERRECVADRRARYAALTPAGTALMERIFPPHARVVEEATSALSAEEKVELIALLRKLGLSLPE